MWVRLGRTASAIGIYAAIGDIANAYSSVVIALLQKAIILVVFPSCESDPVGQRATLINEKYSSTQAKVLTTHDSTSTTAVAICLATIER